MAVRRINESNSPENVASLKGHCDAYLKNIRSGLDSIMQNLEYTEEALNNYNETDDGTAAKELYESAKYLLKAADNVQKNADVLKQFIGFCDIF